MTSLQQDAAAKPVAQSECQLDGLPVGADAPPERFFRIRNAVFDGVLVHVHGVCCGGIAAPALKEEAQGVT